MKYVVGIDEVGRGPLAGPVVVAAVLLPRELRIPPPLKSYGQASKNYELGRLRDSKQLSPKQRERWFKYFKKHPKVFYAIAQVSPGIIDKINISAAANLAAWRAYNKLIHNSKFIIHNSNVYLDGGLYLKGRGQERKGSTPACRQAGTGAEINKTEINGHKIKTHTVIKGDQKIPAISIASIIAKVYRDNLMDKMAKKHPGYGFEVHKGYGTKKHYSALKKLGPSSIHRLTFLDFPKNSKLGRRNFYGKC